MCLKRMCILLFLDVISYTYHLSSTDLLSFNTTIALLTFFLDYLFIDVSGVLKSHTVTVLLSIFSLMYFLLLFTLYSCSSTGCVYVHMYNFPFPLIPLSLYNVKHFYSVVNFLCHLRSNLFFFPETYVCGTLL